MKILGSDFDGTFSYGGINDEKLAAVKKWRRAGNKFGIVSGREPALASKLLNMYPELELDFFAAFNGGYIIDGTGAVLYEARCSETSAKRLTEDLLSLGCGQVFVGSHIRLDVIADGSSAEIQNTAHERATLSNMPDISYFNQISVCLPTEDEAKNVVDSIRALYEDEITLLQNSRCIDIVPRGVNKAEGLLRLAEYYGCSDEDVIAVGDNLNDIDMIRRFRSYAMANGVMEIRDFADGVVSDVTEILTKEL